MLYLILAILSSTLVAVLMRLSRRFSKNGMAMLASNYVMCSAAAAALAGWKLIPSGEGVGMTLLLGGISGVLYLLGFVLLRWCMGRSGVVLPATFQKLGVMLPTLAAVTVFGETISPMQIIGVVIATAAIIMMQGRLERSERKGFLGLIALLLVCGGCDLMAKVFETVGNPAQNDQYLFYTFATALALCIILCGVKKQRVAWADVLCGFAIGIPNYLSARFLLLSLTEVDAVVVYPTFSVGVIVMVAAVGMLLFRERLERRKLIALGMILGALVLLNI